MVHHEARQPGHDIVDTLSVSSVGAIAWPPIEGTEQRKKGICPDIITTPVRLAQVLDDFKEVPLDDNTTRVSGRIFVEKEIFQTAGLLTSLGLQTRVEGIVPLTGTGVRALEDCVMVYLGRNAQTRRTSTETKRKELEMAREIFGQHYRPVSHHEFDKDIRFQEVSDKMRNDHDLQRQYYELYTAFGWSESDVVQLIQNPNNLLITAFKGGELVSAGMGEFAPLKLSRDGHPVNFTMCEITEAATKEVYRGNGLYTEVGKMLMRALLGHDVNLIYAESNLLAPGVLKAAVRQGRHSVLDTFTQFGYETHPLEQHVRISGGSTDKRPHGEKNDLLVTYLSREEQVQKYGNQSR